MLFDAVLREDVQVVRVSRLHADPLHVVPLAHRLLVVVPQVDEVHELAPINAHITLPLLQVLHHQLELVVERVRVLPLVRVVRVLVVLSEAHQQQEVVVLHRPLQLDTLQRLQQRVPQLPLLLLLVRTKLFPSTNLLQLVVEQLVEVTHPVHLEELVLLDCLDHAHYSLIEHIDCKAVILRDQVFRHVSHDFHDVIDALS